MTEKPSQVQYWNEKWVVIPFDGVENPPRYEVSNYGRIRSFQSGNTKGTIIRGSVIQGYRSLNIRVVGGKTINRYVHKLVAELFTGGQSESKKYVIHLDFDKQNNRAENLKWVTKDEMVEHNRQNPSVINRKIPRKTRNYKLTESKVKVIKKMLRNEKNRLKTIAKQFGITHTQLNRIRSGENWRHVTLDDE
ncbi:MAG: NUMOD4 motif-containing HNH endonuclease [Spirosomaceae bacterium]|jgi:DNA-binding Xre family transcriptional regulator|nr:NUMOD4 motif-containing HNH endonuclease [Spirosomataceae bacterium]